MYKTLLLIKQQKWLSEFCVKIDRVGRLTVNTHIGNVDIFPYTCISPSDIITISIKELTLIFKIISQCDVIYMYIMSLPIKTLTSVFKISNNIITNIPTRSIILAAILVIMSVSTLKIALILYTFIDLKKISFCVNGIQHSIALLNY